MTITDPMTAGLLAERMVNSFFDGLSEAERMELVCSPASGKAELSPSLSMMAYTLDCYLGSLALPEEQGKQYFKQAVRKKMEALRAEYSRKSTNHNQKQEKT